MGSEMCIRDRPEVMRLQQLLEHGFLANIERAYQRCLYAVLSDQQISAHPAESSKQSQDLIVNVVTLSNQWLPDESTIREWRSQFLDLIEQLRGGMVEY